LSNVVCSLPKEGQIDHPYDWGDFGLTQHISFRFSIVFLTTVRGFQSSLAVVIVS
jgi:hypothetical protein